MVPLGPAARPVSTGASTAGATATTAPAPAPKQQASLGNAAANPAAQAQYKTGYDAIVKGDYAGATTSFRAFIKQYPDDPQAADATNWLGEALLQQQNYVDAAAVLVTGYKNYPDSPRAPDMLLKLGIALAGAQQQDTACKTFGLLAQKYPNTTTAFRKWRSCCARPAGWALRRAGYTGNGSRANLPARRRRARRATG